MPTNTCPHCKAAMQGAPIPKEHQHHFGNHSHFSRVIAVYDQRKDCTVKYRCPDCNGEWKREGSPTCTK